MSGVKRERTGAVELGTKVHSKNWGKVNLKQELTMKIWGSNYPQKSLREEYTLEFPYLIGLNIETVLILNKIITNIDI